MCIVSFLVCILKQIDFDSFTGTDGLSALHLACEANCAEIVQLLMYHGCDVNLPARSGMKVLNKRLFAIIRNQNE